MRERDETPGEDKFSDDPEENLRLENEFLKLKLNLEAGVVFKDQDLPPDIENELLKETYELSKAYDKNESRVVRHILGYPVFPEESLLDDEAFEMENDRLNKLLEEHCIIIEFGRDRDDRFKYRFITTEIFEAELTCMPLPGLSFYFTYEDFHPDHERDILAITSLFFEQLLNKDLDHEANYISKKMLSPDGIRFSRKKIIDQIHILYESVIEFRDFKFTIKNISFEVKESDKRPSGTGFIEGLVSYEMVYNDGSVEKIYGPYKIYLTKMPFLWEIRFFYFCGFNIAKLKRNK